MAHPLTEKQDLANNAVLQNVNVQEFDSPVTARQILAILRDYTTAMHSYDKCDFLPIAQLARHLGMTYYGCTNFVREHELASKRTKGGRTLYSLYDAKKIQRAVAQGIIS